MMTNLIEELCDNETGTYLVGEVGEYVWTHLTLGRRIWGLT
jgi:hypothetical protein